MEGNNEQGNTLPSWMCHVSFVNMQSVLCVWVVTCVAAAIYGSTSCVNDTLLSLGIN